MRKPGTKEEWEARRMIAANMFDLDKETAEVAATIGVASSTVNQWRRAYRTGGRAEPERGTRRASGLSAGCAQSRGRGARRAAPLRLAYADDLQLLLQRFRAQGMSDSSLPQRSLGGYDCFIDRQSFSQRNHRSLPLPRCLPRRPQAARLPQRREHPAVMDIPCNRAA